MQCATEEKEGIHIIRLPASVDVKDSAAMEAQIKSWLQAPSSIHVVDFRDVKDLRNSSYRYFVMFSQALKSNNKQMFATGVTTLLTAQLRQDGLADVFPLIPSVADAKKRAQGPAKMAVDVEFINPFISASKSVLETQAQLKITSGKARLRKATESMPVDIAGVINLVCTEFKGCISLCFKADVFFKVYEKMVGEKHSELTTEIQDAAAEMLNMIFGQAKTVLNDEKGYQLEKAVPSILVGEKLRAHQQMRVPAILLPFESSAGAFHLEIVVDRV